MELQRVHGPPTGEAHTAVDQKTVYGCVWIETEGVV